MPHPDDETFACGGTIAMYTQAGTPVTYLCATRGEMGRNMGIPPFATRESLPDLRERELREACRILGIKDLRLLGIRDKTVEFVDPAWLDARVRAAIDELEPDVILTYHPTHGVHPDHNAFGAAVVRVVGAMPPERRPVVLTRAFGPNVHEIGEPDVIMDVSGVMDIKMAAIAAHRSQSDYFLTRAAQDPAVREQMVKQRGKENCWTYKF
jgi:bacillithiol biosynthesis deacetylase BshB2